MDEKMLNDNPDGVSCMTCKYFYETSYYFAGVCWNKLSPYCLRLVEKFGNFHCRHWTPNEDQFRDVTKKVKER